MAKTFVVICTRNRPNQLLDLLKDLGVQTEPITKVVIVDSSDTASVMEHLENIKLLQVKEIAYLHSRSGLPYQRNVALKFLKDHWSHEDTVHFLDDDVRVGDSFVRTARGLLLKNPDAALVGAWDVEAKPPKSSAFRKLTLLGESSSAGQLLSSGFAVPPTRPENTQFADWCPGFSLNFRVPKLLGFWFDGRYRMYGEDLEACLRLSQIGPILVSNELYLNHIQSLSGRDDSRAIAYYSDAFRWRLSKLEPMRVRRSAVLSSTLALLVGELALSMRSRSRVGLAKAFGHIQFFWDLIRRRVSEQLILHDHLDLEPIAVFIFPNRT